MIKKAVLENDSLELAAERAYRKEIERLLQ